MLLCYRKGVNRELVQCSKVQYMLQGVLCSSMSLHVFDNVALLHRTGRAGTNFFAVVPCVMFVIETNEKALCTFFLFLSFLIRCCYCCEIVPFLCCTHTWCKVPAHLYLLLCWLLVIVTVRRQSTERRQQGHPLRKIVINFKAYRSMLNCSAMTQILFRNQFLFCCSCWSSA